MLRTMQNKHPLIFTIILASTSLPYANARSTNGTTSRGRTGIVGGAIAGIVIVALISLLLCYTCFRRRRLASRGGVGYRGYNNGPDPAYGPGANVGPSAGGGYGWGGRGLFGGRFFNRGAGAGGPVAGGMGMDGAGYQTGNGAYYNAGPGVAQPPPAYGGPGSKREAGYGYNNSVA